MEGKRYFFKLEMEQLPDDVWQEYQSCEIAQKMGFKEKSELVDRIETLPDPILDNLKQTLKKLRDEDLIKLIKSNPEKFRMFLLAGSVPVSEEDRRLTELEDEAWKDL